MWLELDRDDGIARPARSRLALAGKPHLGAVFNPGGQLEVDRLAVGQGDALGGAGRRIGQRDAQLVLHTGTFGCGPLARTAKPATTTATSAEQPVENVADVDAFSPAPAIIFGAKTALSAAVEPARPGGLAIAKAHAGIALGVDFAAVEAGALVLVGQQIVRAGDDRKAFGRLGIILVAIGVQFFGELAIGRLDVFLARVARYAQGRIWISHKR